MGFLLILVGSASAGTITTLQPGDLSSVTMEFNGSGQTNDSYYFYNGEYILNGSFTVSYNGWLNTNINPSNTNMYVIIEAQNSSYSYSGDDINITKYVVFPNGTARWLVYSTNPSDSDQVVRAKIMKELFYNERILSFTNVSKLMTSYDNDVGKRAHLINVSYNTNIADTSKYTATFSNNLTNNNCSSWSYIYAEYVSSDTAGNGRARWELPVGITLNQVYFSGVTDGDTYHSTSDDLGKDTSSDDFYNPNNAQVYFNKDSYSTSFYSNIKSLILANSSISWSEDNPNNKLSINKNIDFYLNYTIPLFTQAPRILAGGNVILNITGNSYTLNENITSNEQKVDLATINEKRLNLSLYSDVSGNITISNISLNTQKSVFYSQSYSSNVVETSNQIFNSTILFTDGENPVVYLHYDGTDYLATQYEKNTNNASYYVNLTIPLVSSGDIENKTFWWKITDSEETYNSSQYNQSVYRIYLAKCNSSITTNAINFTFKDETTNALVNSDFDSGWSFWSVDGSGSLYRTYYTNVSGSSTYNFCIYPVFANLTASAELEYTATGYTYRDYYLNDVNIDNSSENIDLYLANETNALEFQISLLDENGVAIPQAYIHVQRYFRESGSTKTVEILKTDSSGRDIAHFLMNGEEYQLVAYEDNSLVHNGLPFKPYCPQAAVGDPCEREIRLGYSESPLLFTTDEGLTYNLTYDNSTKKFMFYWFDSSGETHTATLTVKQTILSDVVICDKTDTSATGTLICDISNYSSGDFVATANIHSNPNYEILYETLNEYNKTFGKDGLFWAVILFMSFVFIGLATKSFWGIGIMIILSVFFISLLGLVYIPFTAIMGLVVALVIVLSKVRGI